MKTILVLVLIATFAVAVRAADDAMPTLDELLKIPSPAGGKNPPKRDSDVAAPMGGQPIEQVFDDMRDVSQRLGESRDTGLQTQRIQERILAQLDQLIKAAERSQSSSSSSSSSSEQKQESGSSANQPQQGGEAAARNRTGDNRGQNNPPAKPAAAGDSHAPLAERRVEWGNLPPRLRDELLQGSGERFSPVYQDLTEEYYRRIAEQK